jgi:hypothetical protein
LFGQAELFEVGYVVFSRTLQLERSLRFPVLDPQLKSASRITVTPPPSSSALVTPKPFGTAALAEAGALEALDPPLGIGMNPLPL